MIRIFRHYISVNALILALIEFLIIAFFIDYHLETSTLYAKDQFDWFPYFFGIAAVMLFASFGIYNRDIATNRKIMGVRFALGFFLILLFCITVNKFMFHFVDIGGFIPSWLVVVRILTLASFLFIVRLIYIQTISIRFFKRKILVIGAGKQAEKLTNLFNPKRDKALSFTGYISFEGAESKCKPLATLPTGKIDLKKLLNILNKNKVQEIIFAPDDKRGIDLEPFLYLKMRGIRVYSYLEFVEQEKGRIEIDDLSPSWFIFSDGFQAGPFQNSLKRVVDVCLSLLILILALPIMLLTALLIRLDSKGDVIFSQKRVGRDGKVFKLYKFRSMREDAEKHGPKWADAEDTRITRLGKFLRKTRIDELPQLINVLKSEMSFIGPRPERPVFVKELTQKIPFYAERHAVKPGLTGWAQINYPYGASIEDAKQKLCYDLYYAKNKSLLLDIIIVLQTIRVVLWPIGVR